MTFHKLRLSGAVAALLSVMAAQANALPNLQATAPGIPAATADSTATVAAATPAAAELPVQSLSATPPTAQQPVIEQFSRDITKATFVPKGQWITGVSVSYSQSHQDNYTFFVLEHLNGDTYTFKVSPMLFYSFKDNLAAGGRFAYQRSRTQLDSGYLNLGEDTNYDIDHLYRIAHNFYVGAGFRNYLPLGNTLRFGFFNEVQLQLGGGQSKIENGSGEDLTGTYETNFNLSVGLQPGLVVFLNNYSAIEVSVGVLGFEYTHTHATTDRIYESTRNTKTANFRINLFSIQFGAAFYL